MSRTKHLLFLMLACLPLAANAADPSVTIESPADGARIDAMAQTKLVYKVEPGPKGDHTHLYVDGKEAAILRSLAGSHTLATLAPGSHDICIKVVNKAHTPIGVEKCIEVTVQ